MLKVALLNLLTSRLLQIPLHCPGHFGTIISRYILLGYHIELVPTLSGVYFV